MFRSIIACYLLAGTISGCAGLPASAVNEYRLTGSMISCSELEGNGDCQPYTSERHAIELTGL
jgi:hypothetical protein